MGLLKRLSIYQLKETSEKVLETTLQCILKGLDLKVKILGNLYLRMIHHSLVITSETLFKRN